MNDVKNLWPAQFEPEALRPAKKILEEQGLQLAKITSGMVHGVVSTMRNSPAAFEEGLECEFYYRFSIIGPCLNNYSYSLLYVAHSIALYPVFVAIDPTTSKELQLSSGEQHLEWGRETAKSSNDFEELLGRVFRSERVRRVVSSIVTMSK